jgi:hypothetical protein
MYPSKTYYVEFSRSIMQLAADKKSAEKQAKTHMQDLYPNADLRDYDIDVAFIEQRDRHSCYEVTFRFYDFISVPFITVSDDEERNIDDVKAEFIREHNDFGITEPELTVEPVAAGRSVL